MKLIIFVLVIFFSPCQAYTNTDNTVVIRKRNHRKALLDYKFLIIESQNSKKSVTNDTQGLSSINSSLTTISKKPISRPNSPKTAPREEDTWDNYAIEENLGVSARLLSR
jgi:hypothetical protein